jgi:hypothetical protein
VHQSAALTISVHDDALLNASRVRISASCCHAGHGHLRVHRRSLSTSSRRSSPLVRIQSAHTSARRNELASYESFRSLTLVRHVARALFLTGVYVDGVPACWALESAAGVLTMLHTQIPYRGRGLAAVCVDAFCASLIRRDPTAHPYAQIVLGNKASESVFRRCNFTRADAPHNWAMFRPKRVDTTTKA